MRKTLTALALMFTTFVAVGQTTTATLVGRTTAGDAALPGVLVTISSPALIGTRTVVTAADGNYVVPALPPGEYVIRFEMDGLEPVAQRATLRLAQMTRVDADMKPAVLQSEIVVRPASESLLETPQVSTNFTGEIMELLPTARGILDAVRLAPGILQDGARNLVSINGGEVYDNLYMVNGVTVGNRASSTPMNLFIEDAIQETTILSSGISAEYGRFTGGVVNVITKSGGNEMSGSFRDTIGSDSWTARTPFAAEPEHLDEIYHELQGTLGGRIIRDRLWFFVSGRYYDRNFNRSTRLTELPFIFTDHEERGEAKLTFGISRNQTLVGSYLEVEPVKENLNAGVTDLRALHTSYFPHSLLAFHYTGVFGSNLVGEVQYSKRDESSYWTGGGDGTDIGNFPIQDFNTGAEVWASALCGVCGGGYGDVRDALVKGSWFAPSTRLGTHEVAFGVGDYHEYGKGTITPGPLSMILYAPVAVENGQTFVQLFPDETYLEWWVYPESRESDFNARAAYINDRMSFGTHLTASLGFRYDKNYATTADGRAVVNDARLSPRVGFVYDVFGNGRDRASASFSRYTAKPQEAASSGADQAQNPTLYFWIYDGEPVNEDLSMSTPEVLQTLLGWFEARGGKDYTDDAFIASLAPFDMDGTLDSPYSDEIAVGYARRFGRNTTAQLTLVDRTWSSFFTYGTDLSAGPGVRPSGERYDRLLLTTEDEGLERKYRSAQLQANYQRGRFTAGGNYTYATLRGNVETAGGSGAPNPQRSPASFYPEYTNFPQYAPIGYLNGDVRHTANGWLIFRLPGDRHRTTLSILQRYHTGRPYNMLAQVDITALRPNPGYISRTIYGNYYFQPRGSLRLDDVTSTGIGLHYSVQIGGVELLAHGNVMNVFNEQAIENPSGIQTQVRTSVFDRSLAPFNPLTTEPVPCPSELRTSNAACRGKANYQIPADFGQPRSVFAYQQPRTYTLSMAVRF
jgi:hypothetical protein